MILGGNAYIDYYFISFVLTKLFSFFTAKFHRYNFTHPFFHLCYAIHIIGFFHGELIMCDYNKLGLATKTHKNLDYAHSSYRFSEVIQAYIHHLKYSGWDTFLLLNLTDTILLTPSSACVTP